MPITKDQFLNAFTKQALDERISLFLGAGGSCDAGYPNWADLFNPLAKELGVPINESTDYYKLAQYYSNCFGLAELRKLINEQININNYQSELINELVDVNFSNVWTTNFDNSMENNYKLRNIRINKIFSDANFSNIDFNKRINIIKLNGDISDPEGVIATQNDYENYSDSHKIMLMFFKRELISTTFLFVGYSFTDHLVLDCISEINRYLGGSANYHYTIMKNNIDDPYFRYFVEDLEQRYHVKVLLVNEYSEIRDIMSDLNSRIRNKKIFISGSFSSYQKNIENFSHDFSKAITEVLLKNDYRIVNGIGRRFGTHLIGYANEYLAKNGVKDVEKHIVITPFVGKSKQAPYEKRALREKVIGKCGSSLFIFGENDNNAVDKKSGVLEEFEIAHKKHKAIIPISYPGMISEYIWDSINNNITEYPYLENKMHLLTSSNDMGSLCSTVLQILDSLQ
ncbi:MAG: SIR2 family protein [Ruminococcus sp.]|nr:SIR2 family protein [Ruminococcus sp.]